MITAVIETSLCGHHHYLSLRRVTHNYHLLLRINLLLSEEWHLCLYICYLLVGLVSDNWLLLLLLLLLFHL